MTWGYIELYHVKRGVYSRMRNNVEAAVPQDLGLRDLGSRVQGFRVQSLDRPM